ncbi:MAG: 4-phosphoerythronate dehydrogenase PdxB [Bacteroidetes bacterium]|nr:4-phosphoerythronate dehydrogenase PdxB [Bacteroidota bacterium]
MKIVADDKIPFLKGVLDELVDMKYYPGAQITKENLKAADALITRTRTICNAELLEDSSVKLITTATIGTDHIDINYCDSKGIVWKNAPGCNSSSVQQYVASALLQVAINRKLKLSEMTIGVVGVGNVGGKVAKLARALQMNVLLNDPPRARSEGDDGFVSLDKIIEKSDIITFHVPLNRDGEYKTLHLADEAFFKKFNSQKIILNTSRGPVIETNALKNAIRQKKIPATVLDVWEKEPEIDLELLELVDIATPHIAGYSMDGKANGTAVCINEIVKFFNLKMENDWYPHQMPQPAGATILHVNCEGKSKEEILHEIINSTHNIMEDHQRLVNSPETFEKQRGDYPVRREFPLYSVHLKNPEEHIVNTLQQLGFKLFRS